MQPSSCKLKNKSMFTNIFYNFLLGLADKFKISFVSCFEPLSKGIFRPLSNINDRTFLAKIVNGWKLLTFFAKKATSPLFGSVCAFHFAERHSTYCFYLQSWNYSLREKSPNTELFLVRIFLYSDWVRGKSLVCIRFLTFTINT